MEWPNIDINGSLQRFNEWFDSFILEAIKPLSILSMGLGTVAVFNLQGLAIDPRFVVSWAIVQALSMDGLFFATWDKLFSVKLQWRNALAIIGLGFIGLTLAIVAIAINAILGFQVLWGIADSQAAMSRIGISSELFTIVRAILAVAVFVMVSFVRSRARATTKPTVAIVETQEIAIPDPPKRSKSRRPVVVNGVPLAMARAVFERDEGKCVECGYEGEYLEYDHIIPRSKGGGDEVDNLQLLCRSCNISKGAKLVTVTPERKAMLSIPVIAESTHRDRIKEVWVRHMEAGKDINYKVISKEAGVGYSTVKKWAGDIRREIEQSTGGQ